MSALVVYQKELLDTLRDRRTLAAMILVPMVVYPATLLITTETIVGQEKASGDGVVHVGAAPDLPDDLHRFLQEEPKLALTTLSTSAFGARQARAALKDDLHVLMVLSATSAVALSEGGTAEVTLYVDDTQPSGDAPRARLQAVLRRYSEHTRDLRLKSRGLSPAMARPLSVQVRTVATDKEQGNHLLSLILPSLVLLFVALSSLYPAIDLTAGEKERKTLGTLLTSPVALSDIVLGKLLAVVTVGTFAGMLNVAALGLTFLRVMHSTPAAAKVSFDVGLGTALGLMGAVLAAAFPLGALMLLFASFARSFRDANLLLTPVLLIAMLPAGVVMLPGAELNSGFCLVPIANAALWMKALLSGPTPPDRVLLVLLSSAGMTAVLAAGVVRAFSDERALFSSEGRRADFARLLLEPPRPGLGAALAFVAVGFAVSFFVSLVVSEPPMASLVVTQVLGYLLPAYLVARWMAGSGHAHRLLATQGPSRWAALGGLVLGLSAWLGLSTPGGWLTEWLIPGQAEAGQALAAALGVDQQPLWVLLICVALLPALAEELAFRGVVFHLLGAGRGAVLGQAVLFGLVHGSIYRFLPTFVLGLVLGQLRRRSGSVWPGILAHALTNGIIVGVHRLAPPAWEKALSSPSSWALVGLAGVGLAGLLLRLDRAGHHSGSLAPNDRLPPAPKTGTIL